MRVEVVLRTVGQPDAVVGEAEGDTWPQMREALPALLRDLADAVARASDLEEVPDASA
ncbi:hypothetical protein [Streptomyces sp. CC224B]|uniref:hypothetical protein n=1 Tax=Streptomyces sp. CC224B TaxID=3044571 RepID=UPI0024A912E1|nr:hypothetical protein [Streptomyces sp. CC224B]